jgi:aryl-alcohol dehydrogenase-like predicted oxidoreductase
VLGRALKGIRRDSYVLSTKAGRYGFADFDFSRDRILASAHESMRRLGVDYLDILNLHDIEYEGGRHIQQALTEGIEALQLLKAQGKVRFYGVTAYPLKVFRHVLETVEVDTVLIHNHYSLIDTTLTGILSLLEQRDIGLINASPLASGLLSSRGPAAWHPATKSERELLTQAVRLCQRRGALIEKLAIQFAFSRNDIPTTLVSTADPENLRRNVEWLAEPLDERLVIDVRHLLANLIDKEWDFDQAATGVQA